MLLSGASENTDQNLSNGGYIIIVGPVFMNLGHFEIQKHVKIGPIWYFTSYYEMGPFITCLDTTIEMK